MITEHQQRIYNTYLKVYARNNERGYKQRKDFSKIDENIHKTLQRLERFFNEHSNIAVGDFFQSGFTFLNRKFVPIEFFVTYKAIVGYKRTRGVR